MVSFFEWYNFCPYLMCWISAPVHRRAFAFVKFTEYEASQKAIKEEVHKFSVFIHKLIF